MKNDIDFVQWNYLERWVTLQSWNTKQDMTFGGRGERRWGSTNEKY